jgi:hypothetical protein
MIDLAPRTGRGFTLSMHENSRRYQRESLNGARKSKLIAKAMQPMQAEAIIFRPNAT